jgi:pimeloyl-ACP methyl ester carboxylesterase
MPPGLQDQEHATIPIPCVVYLGENDVFYNANKLKQRLDSLDCNIKTHIVKGAGHLLNFEFGHYLMEGLT